MSSGTIMIDHEDVSQLVERIDAEIMKELMAYPISLEQQQRLHEIYDQVKAAACRIADAFPRSRERIIAFTQLETVMFWAVAGITRYEGKRS